MGESFSTSDATHISESRTTAPSPVAEDDDEPPSSGSAQRASEVNQFGSEPTSRPCSLYSANAANSSDHAVDSEKCDGTVIDPDAATDSRPLKAPRRPIISKDSPLRALFTPTRPLGPRPTYAASFIAALEYTPLNICLVFIPVSWVLHYTHQSPTLIFVFSCLAIVPLAALLGLGTEQIAIRTSQSVGGLLNATLGNIVEMIIAGIALKQCELELVQSSLLGGLLSNLLLVLGMAFIVGGLHFPHQEFQPMVAQLNSSLMIVSVTSLIIPVAFHEYLEDRLAQGTEVSVLLQLSRGSAIILMFIYFAYLYFQFYSHNHLFLDTFQTTSSPNRSFFTRSSTLNTVIPLPTVSSAVAGVHLKLNTPSAIFLLLFSTGLAYPTAEHLVSSLQGLVAAHPNISKKWITLIVIPIISNAAEHTTAVVVARKGKFDLAMSVAVGSCIQIGLFVIPMLILIAWGMEKPLTLLFDPLETIVLFFSVLLVKFSIEDGKSHWLSGLILMAVYAVIALSFWYFPETTRTLQGQALVCT